MNQRIQRIFIDLNILKLNFQKDSKSFKSDKKRTRDKNQAIIDLKD